MLNKICQLIRLGTGHCFRLSLSQITSEKTLKALKTWNVTDSSSSMEEEDEGNFILTFRLKVSDMCWWKESSEFALVHFDHMMNVSVVVINDEKCVGCMRTATLLQLDCAKSRKKDLGTDAGSEEKREVE